MKSTVQFLVVSIFKYVGAHIMNFVMHDGLNENIEHILRVRNGIKYVKQSTSRWAKWKARVKKEKIAIETRMCLDVQTY